MVNNVFNIFKKRTLGDRIILTKDIKTIDSLGNEQTIPGGTICINYGVPSLSWKYNKSYIELKLLKPSVNGMNVTSRLVLKRNSDAIKTYEGICE